MRSIKVFVVASLIACLASIGVLACGIDAAPRCADATC